MPKGIRNPDYSGKTVHHLTLIRKAIDSGTDNRKTYWHCKCICGKEIRRREDAIFSGRTVSCGCKTSSCFKSGKSNSLWKGCGDISGQYFASIRSSASKRNLEFNITIDYIWRLFEEQNGKCALSGLKIKFYDGTVRNKRSNQTASLDRINPNLGYIEGNVWWVHKVVNQMRNHYDIDVFYSACRAVARKNPGKVNRKLINEAKGTRNATTGRRPVTLS